MSKREILFKAKRIDNGEWVEGFPYWGEYTGAFILQNKPVKKKNARTGDITLSDEVVPIAVDGSTICQYTGLTDSDGKKVFEGDILEFEERNEGYKWTARVEFGNPNGTYTWGWQLVWMNGEKPNPGILLWFDMEESGAFSKVIGNIYDKEAQQ